MGIAATLPLILGLLLMRRARRGALGRLNAVVDEFLVPLFAGVGWPQLALVSLLAGVGEELFFRGVIAAGADRLDRNRRRFGCRQRRVRPAARDHADVRAAGHRGRQRISVGSPWRAAICWGR